MLQPLTASERLRSVFKLDEAAKSQSQNRIPRPAIIWLQDLTTTASKLFRNISRVGGLAMPGKFQINLDGFKWGFNIGGRQHITFWVNDPS